MEDSANSYTLDDCEFLYDGTVFDDYTTSDIIECCTQFEFLSDDIVVCTLPRCGTTLTQEIIWNIVNHKTTKKDIQLDSINEQFPFIEFRVNYKGMSLPDPFQMLDTMASPRLIKTHLPYRFLGKQLEKTNPRIVITMRNPKDAAIALFYFCRSLRGTQWACTFDDFLHRFLTGNTVTGDFFTNNLEWWALRHRPNVLILRYEDLVHSKHQQVRIIARFLGYSLTDAEVDAVVHNSDFDTMKKNKNVNVVIGEDNATFLRKGKSGGWRKELSVEQNNKMDAEIEKRTQGTGLRFIF